MDNRQYIGMDVHQASISIAVSDAAGKVLMECIIETKAATVLEFTGQRLSRWIGSGRLVAGGSDAQERTRRAVRRSVERSIDPPFRYSRRFRNTG